MTATADITVNKRENAVLVPNAALRFTPPVQQWRRSLADGGLVGPCSRVRRGRDERNKTEEPTAKKRSSRSGRWKDGSSRRFLSPKGRPTGSMTGGRDRRGRARDGSWWSIRCERADEMTSGCQQRSKRTAAVDRAAGRDQGLWHRTGGHGGAAGHRSSHRRG